MNQETRIFILFNQKKKVLLYDMSSNLNAIISLCLKKFELNVVTKDYYLLLESQNYCIQSAQEIRENDVLILMKKRREEDPSLNLELKPSTTSTYQRKDSLDLSYHSNDSENQTEIRDRKEVEERRWQESDYEEEKWLFEEEDAEYNYYTQKEGQEDDEGDEGVDNGEGGEEDGEEDEDEEEEEGDENEFEERFGNLIFKEISIEEINYQKYATRELLSEELNK